MIQDLTSASKSPQTKDLHETGWLLWISNLLLNANQMVNDLKMNLSRMRQDDFGCNL
ncbi:hypothetical protein EXVG_00158 [Emiliania huxleyi virus 202]|nr:hypothetical protein EXVG_00158 [Emiliania huxleyi virus 202]